jgi:hypothetical protein
VEKITYLKIEMDSGSVSGSFADTEQGMREAMTQISAMKVRYPSAKIVRVTETRKDVKL